MQFHSCRIQSSKLQQDCRLLGAGLQLKAGEREKCGRCQPLGAQPAIKKAVTIRRESKGDWMDELREIWLRGNIFPIANIFGRKRRYFGGDLWGFKTITVGFRGILLISWFEDLFFSYHFLDIGQFSPISAFKSLLLLKQAALQHQL